MPKPKPPRAAAPSTQSLGVEAANNTPGLYKHFPALEPLGPEAENLLAPLIDECTCYSDLLLRVADERLDKRLSFGTLLRLTFWAQVEQSKVFMNPR